MVVVLAVAVVGCGTRVPEKTVAAGNGSLGYPGGAGAPATPGGGGVSGPVPSSVPGGAALAPNGFGSLPNPCGPAPAGATLKATGQGVTESEIDVSTIADPGGIKPGLNQGLFDSMKAFAEWCNGFGGINGRKLVVSYKDAQLTKYKDMIAEACQDSFALVGGLGTLDQLGAQDAVDCGLVNVPAAVVSPEAAGADYTVQPLPNLPGKYMVSGGLWIKSAFPEAPPKAATIYTNFSTTQMQSDKLVKAYGQIGYTFVVSQSAALNETNWAPVVVTMKNADVKYMNLTSSFEEIVPLQKEMAAQNWHPQVTELETNFYNVKYPQLAKEQGADTSGTYVKLTVWPFEEADKNAAMTQYLQLLKKAVPDAQPEELGVQGFSAGLLFATAAKAAGPDLTRESLLTELHKIHSWDGGGLHGVSDPGNNGPSTCVVMMKVVSDSDTPGFVRAYPLPDKDKDVYDKGKGFSCPENGMVTVTGYDNLGAKKK